MKSFIVEVPQFAELKHNDETDETYTAYTVSVSVRSPTSAPSPAQTAPPLPHPPLLTRACINPHPPLLPQHVPSDKKWCVNKRYSDFETLYNALVAGRHYQKAMEHYTVCPCTRGRGLQASE